MTLMPVNKGLKWCKVDDEDYQKFKHLNLNLFPHGNNFYARIGFYDKEFYKKHKKNAVKHKLFHRLILGIEDPNLSVDHIDGDGLNNQKSNLRVCSHKQNCRNRKKNLNGSSRFKGVGFHKRDKIYCANIGLNGKRVHLGNFNSEIEAALAYNFAAKHHYGEFAKLNEVHI